MNPTTGRTHGLTRVGWDYIPRETPPKGKHCPHADKLRLQRRDPKWLRLLPADPDLTWAIFPVSRPTIRRMKLLRGAKCTRN